MKVADWNSPRTVGRRILNIVGAESHKEGEDGQEDDAVGGKHEATSFDINHCCELISRFRCHLARDYFGQGGG